MITETLNAVLAAPVQYQYDKVASPYQTGISGYLWNKLDSWIKAMLARKLKSQQNLRTPWKQTEQSGQGYLHLETGTSHPLLYGLLHNPSRKLLIIVENGD